MKFKRLSAITMAGVMAATSIVCQISAGALEDKVMFTGSQHLKSYVEGSSDHEFTLPTALTGTELSDYENISITFKFTDDEITDLSSNQWKANHLFCIYIDGGVYMTENESIGINAYNSMPTADTEYTVDYKTDSAQEILTAKGGDFSTATAMTIQSGWTPSVVTKVAFTGAKNNLPDKTLVEYDGSPITMTKSFPSWQPAGAAQGNIPVTSLDGVELNKTTYGDLKKLYKSLSFDGIEFVKDSLGGSAGDYTYCLYTQWSSGSTWQATSGVSLDSKTTWFISDISGVDDDATITGMGVQINVSNLSEEVKALKDGETFTINPEDAVETSITLDKTELSLKAGETATLKASTTPADAEVTWKSSNEKIATVKDGVVTAVAAGKAVITATAGDKSAECTVTVSAASEETSITLDKTELSLKAGETAALKASTTPADAEVTWKSSDEKIATVKDGVVTAVAAGKAVITATAGDKSAECTVTVSAAVVDPGDDEDTSDYALLYDKEFKVTDAYEGERIPVKAVAGDKITVTYKLNDAGTYHQLSFKHAGDGWPALTSPAYTNEWNCVDVSADGTFTFTLNAEDAANISANDLVISGYSVTYTKVELNADKKSQDDPDDDDPDDDKPDYDTLKVTKVSDFKTDGTSELYVRSFTLEDVKSFSDVTIIVKLSNGKRLAKDTTKCFKGFKYINTDGDTVTVTSAENYFVVVKIINIPAGVTVEDVIITHAVG